MSKPRFSFPPKVWKIGRKKKDHSEGKKMNWKKEFFKESKYIY